MKIALVAQYSTPVATDAATAGDDARLVEMSKSLAGEGHQVTLYARRNGKQLPERASLADGVSVEYVGPSDSSADDSHLVKQIGAFSAPLHAQWAKDRPDVVHALRWTSGLAALSAARDLQIPVVQSFDQLGVTERRHGLIPAGAGTERIRLEPAIGRTVNAVVAGSYDEESDLTRLGIPRRSIRVVPTGIDTNEFTPEGETYERNDRHRLVTVADLATEQDALNTLLRALAKIPGAELIVAGGPAREDLRGDLSYRRLAKLSDSLDLHGRVFFAGQVGRAVRDHLHPGDGVRHPGRRVGPRGARRRRPRRHHRHPGRARPPGPARAEDPRPARPPDAARGVQRRRDRPGPLPLLLGPHRPRDPRRLRHRPGRVTTTTRSQKAGRQALT
jgi:D-inositol-3-phosphate glycosyltransferase